MSNVIRRAAQSAHGADWKELVPVNKRSLRSRCSLIEAMGPHKVGGQRKCATRLSLCLFVLFKCLISTLELLTCLDSDQVSRWRSEGPLH